MVVRGKPLGRSQQVGGGKIHTKDGPREASFCPGTLQYKVLDNKNLEGLAWCCGGEDLEAHPHDVQTNCSHYRHICVYVYRVDDFGHVDFLSDGQPWPGAVVARGVDVGNGTGTTAAVGELFHGRSEDSCSGRRQEKDREAGALQAGAFCSARIEQSWGGFPDRLPQKRTALVQHV